MRAFHDTVAAVCVFDKLSASRRHYHFCHVHVSCPIIAYLGYYSLCSSTSQRVIGAVGDFCRGLRRHVLMEDNCTLCNVRKGVLVNGHSVILSCGKSNLDTTLNAAYLVTGDGRIHRRGAAIAQMDGTLCRICTVNIDIVVCNYNGICSRLCPNQILIFSIGGRREFAVLNLQLCNMRCNIHAVTAGLVETAIIDSNLCRAANTTVVNADSTTTVKVNIAERQLAAEIAGQRNAMKSCMPVSPYPSMVTDFVT